MTIYANFDQALEAFRRDGGAMIHHQPSSTGPGGWEIDGADAVAERILHTPLEATRIALAAGGLGEAEIDDLLADWQP